MVGLLHVGTWVDVIVGDPLSNSAGIVVMFGGVFEIGEFLKFIRKALS